MDTFRPGLKPEGYAQALLYDWGVNAYPVDPPEICGLLGIGYREADMGTSGGYDGALIREAGLAGVLINSNIPYPERKRFTAAHEIGHYTIKHHNLAQYWCSGRDVVGYRSSSRIESEANAFASELLLPGKFVLSAVKRSCPSFDMARELAQKFGVSLTATALKIVKLAPDACALVLTDRGVIKWTVPSERFRKVFDVRSGPISPDTFAADLFANRPVADAPQKVNAQAWGAVLCNSGTDFLFEHSVAFRDLGLVLTLLAAPEPDPEDDFLVDDDD